MERQRIVTFPLMCWIYAVPFIIMTLTTAISSEINAEHRKNATDAPDALLEEIKRATYGDVSESKSSKIPLESVQYVTIAKEILPEDIEESIRFVSSESALVSTTGSNSLISPDSEARENISTDRSSVMYQTTKSSIRGGTDMKETAVTYQGSVENTKETNFKLSETKENLPMNSTEIFNLNEELTSDNDSTREKAEDFMAITKSTLTKSLTFTELNFQKETKANSEQQTATETLQDDSNTPPAVGNGEGNAALKETESEASKHAEKMNHYEDTSAKLMESGSEKVELKSYDSVGKESIVLEKSNGTAIQEVVQNNTIMRSLSLVNSSDEVKSGYNKTPNRLGAHKHFNEELKETYKNSEDSARYNRRTFSDTDDDILDKDAKGVTKELFNDYDDTSMEATEVNINSTRVPKRIQGSQERYPEGRVRPARPDPGYSHRQEEDLVRPYRPDSPLHHYPYYRPTPDYRTPLIRQDTDFTRPVRPDPDNQRVSFRPNYFSKPLQDDSDSSRQTSGDINSSKPYKPSFNVPYAPHSSFGRPYRPDYQRPSKPSEEAVTAKTNLGNKGIGNPESDVYEHSRADTDYTRQSEAIPEYSKNYQSDIRPSVLKPDISKPYRPLYDGITDVFMQSKPSTAEDTTGEKRDSVKSAKPEAEMVRPGSFYPRPGFGNNYQTPDTSVRPFSIGTVTSAKNLTRVEFIKADCFDNHMKVTMRFNGTFNGLVYSSGYAQDSSCSYVNGSGRNHYEFFIRLNRCGTLGQQEVAERTGTPSRKRQERAQYLVNTVTVQYNSVIEEDIDEHFRVTCEYGYDFWKTVTFPVINVESSAVKVRTGSPVVFTLPPPQCNMEIRSGFGPSGNRVSGPVNVGDPLTLVIHMKSESTGFDILVSNCFAHNGAQKRLQLIDSNGCVVQEKLVSPFRGVSSPDRTQQVTLYSYLKAFRFTGSPALYIECDVHMCHGSCPPQRCYWRHLYKRAAMDSAAETTTPSGRVISESVSLFQSLEVRHEEADAPNPLALRTLNGMDDEDMVCLRTGGFAAVFACLILLLLLTSFACVCLCMRMRKLKSYVDAPDTKHFVEFDVHVPMK